jgi:hypothetical protein
MPGQSAVQNVSAGVLLGSVSGSSAPVGEVTVGAGLSLSGGVLSNTSSISFPVTVPQGGTGMTTLNANGVLFGSGTASIGATAAGAAAALLLGQGTGSAPAFAGMSGGATITSAGVVTLTTFVAAGGSHAGGAVPDPGSTGHANQPYLLADNATFLLPYGRLLAVGNVATNESTGSTGYINLTTTDSVTFNLDAGTFNLLVFYAANEYIDTANNSTRDVVLFAGTADSSSAVDTGFGANINAGVTSVTLYRKTVTVSAGAYTVSVQHAVTGGTGHWRNRTLCVFLSP